ncbi:MAG: hypothetical protein MJ214_02840 [Bacilli bacterium]|nr:hypothetical protein [Bacilli bacterium]
MKKLVFIMPLMAVSLLESCGKSNSFQTTVTFSGESVGCTLYYNDVGYAKDTPITIPAGEDVVLKIEPNQDYLPVFKNGLTIFEAIAYSFNPVKKEITIKVANNGKCVIKAVAESPKENLEAYKWSEISQLSEMGLADDLFKVGDTKKVKVNEQNHDVRIIGFNQDRDKDDNLIGITFEFANLVCDKDGYSLASIWNDTDNIESSNHNYFNSTIHNNLNDTKKGTAKWYTIRKTKKSDEYKDSLLLMLPDDLRNTIIPAKKNVKVFNNNEWIETQELDSLFLLTSKELGYPIKDLEVDVPIYEYYEDCTEQSDSKRQKFQIKGHEGAVCPLEDPPTIESTDLLCREEGGQNFAGYELYVKEIDKDYGNLSWLRSPSIDETGEASCLSTSGDLGVYFPSYKIATSIAPAFCI